MRDFLATAAFVVAMLAVAFTFPVGADARTPHIADVNPDWIGTVDRYGMRAVPPRVCRRGLSDVHAYGVTGKPFAQRFDSAGPFWVDSRGRAVAGFDRENCDFYSFRRAPVIVAAFVG